MPLSILDQDGRRVEAHRLIVQDGRSEGILEASGVESARFTQSEHIELLFRQLHFFTAGWSL